MQLCVKVKNSKKCFFKQMQQYKHTSNENNQFKWNRSMDQSIDK